MATYLLDFACFKPPEELKVIAEECEHYGKHWPQYREEVKDFMWKIFIKSGLSPTSTYLPKNVHPMHVREPLIDLNTAMDEAEMVMGGAVTELLERTGIKPQQIDILITCTSIFCSTPSLSAMLINKFKMRNDIQSYHLGGMGCGTGVIAVNLVRDLLKARPNSVALFVPAEITNYCTYPGEEPNRMVANVIFRMGGAAILFTNRPSLRSACKYELMHAVRTHHGHSDDAYQCMSWGPDAKGINGVYLGKNVIKCAGAVVTETLTKSISRLLTPRQYLEAGANWVARNVLGYKSLPEYMPDFTQCVDHFLIHAGGYAVLKSIQDKTKLPSTKMIPSFAVLREYGNTSCSTTWYAFGYLETCEGVKKGESVLQMGVGGGMKAGSNAWRALRDVHTRTHRAWVHLADTPITEADLPRGIELGDIRDLKSKAKAEELFPGNGSSSAAAAANGSASAAGNGSAAPPHSNGHAAAPPPERESNGHAAAPPAAESEHREPAAEAAAAAKAKEEEEVSELGG